RVNNCRGFDRLVPKLRKRRTVWDAIFEVSAAAWALGSNTIADLEFERSFPGNIGIPDFALITNTAEVWAIECKQIEMGRTNVMIKTITGEGDNVPAMERMIATRVVRAIEDAERQLPRDCRGGVFVRTPFANEIARRDIGRWVERAAEPHVLFVCMMDWGRA